MSSTGGMSVTSGEWRRDRKSSYRGGEGLKTAPFTRAVGADQNHDLNIPTQSIQTLEHLGFADPAKLTPQHPGQFGLGHTEDLGSLNLGQVPMFDNLADLACQGGLDLHFGGICHTEVGVDVSPFAETENGER